MKTTNPLEKVSLEELSSAMEEEPEYKRAGLEQKNLYHSPPGYEKWNNHLKMCFTSGSSSAIIFGYQTQDVTGVKVGELCRGAVYKKAPARYITKELCEAFMETPIPVLTEDILNVLPFMYIMLPKGLIFDHENDEIFSILIATKNKEERNIEIGKEICKQFFSDAQFIPDDVASSSSIHIATFTNAGSSCYVEYIDENAKSWHEENIKYAKESVYEFLSTQHVIRIAINSLLVHLYEPELISTEKPPSTTKGLGFTKGPGKAPLGPTWIGRGFKYERQAQRPSQGAQGVKGSVRAHWRRGHWHSFCCGPKRQERRVQWVKPIYVRGEV